MDLENLGYRVIGCAMEAHRTLGGCGLLESIYEDAFCYELEANGIAYTRQVILPVRYKNTTLSSPLRLDLLVDTRILVECKATLEYNPVFEAQLLTYMRLANIKLGYVINFGERMLKDGVRRVIN